MSALNGTLDQSYLVDIYRSFHSKAEEYIFFSSADGTFSRIDCMLDHWTSLSKLQQIEIMSSIFSDHSGVTLEFNYRKKAGKITDTQRFNYMLLNNQCINEEIKGEIKYLQTNENGELAVQNLWDSEEALVRGKLIAI